MRELTFFLVAMKFVEFATFGTDMDFHFVVLSRKKIEKNRKFSIFMLVTGLLYVGNCTVLCRLPTEKSKQVPIGSRVKTGSKLNVIYDFFEQKPMSFRVLLLYAK